MAEIDWEYSPAGRKRRPPPQTPTGPGWFYYLDRPGYPISGWVYEARQSLAGSVEQRMRQIRYLHEADLLASDTAYTILAHRFEGLDLSVIYLALKAMAWQILEFVGGGAALGAMAGTFLGAGIGTLPSAITGAELGLLLLGWTGLKDIAEYVIDQLPPAIEQIMAGFRDAWTAGEYADPNEPIVELRELGNASWKIAEGQADLLTLILSGLVALGIGRGSSYLLKIVAQSRLGAEGAKWIEANHVMLIARLEAMQAHRRQKTGGAQRLLDTGGADSISKASAPLERKPFKTNDETDPLLKKNNEDHQSEQAADPIARREAEAKTRAHQLEIQDSGHSIARHGPEVSDAELKRRLETGMTPDGKFSPTPASTRFKSYEEWEKTRADALKEISDVHKVDLNQPPGRGQDTSYDVILDHGRAIDEGWVGDASTRFRISNRLNPARTGWSYPNATPVSGITKTMTTVKWNAATARWEVTQHFPEARGWDEATQSYLE